MLSEHTVREPVFRTRACARGKAAEEMRASAYVPRAHARVTLAAHARRGFSHFVMWSDTQIKIQLLLYSCIETYKIS